MSSKSLRLVVIGAGIAAIVAFFLPFLDPYFDPSDTFTMSGWDIMWREYVPWGTRLPLAMLPLGGLVLIAGGISGDRGARLAGLGFGAGVFGFLGYSLVSFFFATTGAGLWLAVAVAATTVVAALMAKKS